MNTPGQKNWESIRIDSSDTTMAQEVIRKLVNNEIAALVVPKIFLPNEIDDIVARIKKQGVSWYPNFEFKQGRIGIAATEYAAKIHGKELYFLSRDEASRIRNNIFPGDLDPIHRMKHVFASGFDVDVATEPSNGEGYFTGLIRAMQSKSTVHYDFAPDQLPGWGVAEAQDQFAVVTYLQMPEEGGATTIYDRKGSKNDDRLNKDKHEKGPYGYEADFLEGTRSLTVLPKVGEMVVFNSRNFHSVQSVISNTVRLSINSFMTLKDGKLSLWN